MRHIAGDAVYNSAAMLRGLSVRSADLLKELVVFWQYTCPLMDCDERRNLRESSMGVSACYPVSSNKWTSAAEMSLLDPWVEKSHFADRPRLFGRTLARHVSHADPTHCNVCKMIQRTLLRIAASTHSNHAQPSQHDRYCNFERTDLVYRRTESYCFGYSHRRARGDLVR